MKGKVKFYKESDGYGFIQGDDGQEYYFNMHDLKVFDETPRTGHRAEFTPVPVTGGGRKPKAANITVSAPPRNQASGPARTDDRITCPHCQRKIVPRMVTYHGEPDKSFCPYCGGVVKKFSSCFIATAVYGDPLAPEVIAIRRFRNEVLLPRWYGRIITRCYYRVSPPVAAALSGKTWITNPLKRLLDILARRYG